MKLKTKLRTMVTQNQALAKIYDIYYGYARYAYQLGKPKIVLDERVKVEAFEQGVQSFFGYYDKSPQRNGHYIYHVLDYKGTALDHPVAIYCDERKLGSSTSWNWQQGTMLSWLDDDHIIYNVVDGGEYHSRITDINDGSSRLVGAPIYKLSADGSFALSLNFRRLAKLRPDYGYFNLPYDDIRPLDDQDGVFYVDLLNDTCRLLISLTRLAAFKPLSSMTGAYHKVNHIDLSPNQGKIDFLHRWFDKQGVKHTRLMLYDLHTDELRILADEDMVSHCTWLDDQTIVGYLRHNQHDGYYRIDISGGAIEAIDDDLRLADDGHPSFAADHHRMITDSYPDYTCKSKLLLYDIIKRKTTVLGAFYSPRRYQGTVRCDLHPRWSPDKQEITFDSVCMGVRRMYRMDVSKVKEVV